jgi:hypothetical protein
MGKKRLHVFLIVAFIAVCPATLPGQSYYEIMPLPFNTKIYDEFSPVYYEDGLIFCSNRKNDFFVTYTDTSARSLPLIDLYIAREKRNENWTNPHPLSPEINTNFQEGPVTYDNVRNRLYFSRNIQAKKKFGNFLRPGNHVGIFYADLVREDWRNITAFRHNAENYNVMHPTISEDGEILVFTSNMPGGFGGYDLYMCKSTGSNWGKPVNLGEKINSPANEVFPCMHPSGRLYFSSDNNKGLGKLDIYYTIQTSDEWLDPVQLKQPFNSSSDDFGYIANQEFEAGFFTTNREGSDDIYRFTSVLPTFESCSELQENNYCFTFFEEGTMDLDSTTLKYEWDLGDGTKVRGLEADHCFEGPGTYVILLNVIDTLTGEVYFNEATHEFLLEDIEQPYIIAPDSALVKQEVTFNGTESFIKEFEISDYIWNFGDGNKKTGSTVTHTYLKPGEYQVKLGITGVQDSIGNTPKACSYKTIRVFDENSN